MDNFQAIGQLVIKAQDLLDSIKGGAIRVMQTQFDVLKQVISSEWSDIKTKMNNEALAAISRVDTQTVIADLGFEAYNLNGDFIDVNQVGVNNSGHVNTYPSGAGLGVGRNDGVKSEVIACQSGSTPSTRDPIVRELLDFMGIGASTTHFSDSFNIWKLTVVDPSVLDSVGFDFYLPSSQIKTSPSTTFMQYVKTEGQVSLNLGGNTGGVWERFYLHSKSAVPGLYTVGDLYLESANVGDVVYIALPMICTGKFPETVKHGSLVNNRTLLSRKIDKNHPA